MQSYELCSDMIDVVIDVSCIYGLGEVVCLLFFASARNPLRPEQKSPTLVHFGAFLLVRTLLYVVTVFAHLKRENCYTR